MNLDIFQRMIFSDLKFNSPNAIKGILYIMNSIIINTLLSLTVASYIFLSFDYMLFEFLVFLTL